MCALCAAIPATLALGAADQAHRQRSLGASGERRLRPISVRAALLVAALVAASAVYHLKFLSA